MTVIVLYRHASGREYRTTSEAHIGGIILFCSTYERDRRTRRRWRTDWERS